MITQYQTTIIAAILFATTFFSTLILYDFLSSFVRQKIHQWEVREYLKIQVELERALEIAQQNQEHYRKLFGNIAKAFQEAAESEDPK